MASILAAQGSAALRQGRQQPAAVLFADIRGFTARAEALPPPELARFMSAFRRRATRAIELHSGIIDKFIGDAVMAIFGVPDPGPSDAANAVRAALALLNEIDDWNREAAAEGLPSVCLGVGVHHGLVFAGALGDEARQGASGESGALLAPAASGSAEGSSGETNRHCSRTVA